MFNRKNKLIAKLQQDNQRLRKEIHGLRISCEFELPYVEFPINKSFNNDPQCEEHWEACERHVAIATDELLEKNMDFLSERCYELYKEEGGKW